MRISYRFGDYAKAGMVFAATTASYFFARATGVLPSWLNSEKSETTDIAVSEPATIQPMGVAAYAVANDFSFDDLSVTDFEEVDLTPAPAELAREQPDIEEQYRVKTEPAPHPVRRHLLQQSSSVSVVNPIPDQVIQVNQQYVYSLDDVFAGDYSLLDAVETGTNSLPSWLSLQPRLLSTFSAGQAYGVAMISGSMAFVMDETGLQIIDVSNPSSLRLLSSFPAGLGGDASEVAISGSTAFVANGDLQIIDFSNLSNPRLLSSWVADTNGVAISGSTAFVAGGYAGLQIIDVSNLTSPRLLSSFPARTGYTYGVAVSGSTAFIVNEYGGLQIIDVSNPSNPRLLSSFPTVDAVGVAISGSTAFVAQGVAGLQIIDVSNVSSPRLLSSFPAGFGGYAFGVAISGSMAFFADGSGGLQIIDVSRGSLIGAPPLSLLGQSLSITVSARNMSQELMSDQFTLILDQLPQVVTSSVSDQSVYPGNSLTLLLNSGLLFANPRNTFLKLSVALSQGGQLPAWLNLNVQPISLSVFSAGSGRAYGVAISGSTAFVAGGDLQIIDVSNPSSPRLLSSFYNGYAQGVAISGSTAFIVGRELQILDVSNPSNPSLLSSFPVEDWGNSVAISGNTAFVENTIGLQLIDVSNLSSPHLLSSYPAGTGYAYGVAISGSTVFVADYDQLQIIDVSNPRTRSCCPPFLSGRNMLQE